MICKECRHEIGPEELKCPYCGADNPFALQHKQNMKKFKKEYAKAKREVSEFAGHVKGLSKKAAVLAALLIGILTAFIITSVNYADTDTDEDKKNDALRHADEYCGQVEEYLKNGEYTECSSFMYAHGIMSVSSEKYDGYRHIKYILSDYTDCIGYIEQLVLRSTDKDYYDNTEMLISHFCRHIESFDEDLENMLEWEKNEDYKAYMKDMDEELRIAMRIYFEMSEEELEEFLSLSQAKKAVKLEEVFGYEK